MKGSKSMQAWDGNGTLAGRRAGEPENPKIEGELHPAWQSIIRFCQEMGYGEIACLKIHGGLPVSADVVTRKIRWY